MFAEFLPLVPYCNYADCTHIHEQGCAVKEALRKRHISERRYLSYLGLFNGLAEDAE